MKRMTVGVLAGVMTLAVCDAWAQTRPQTVALEKGWNAVWLEVQPTNASVTAFFAGMPVDIVAAYTLPVSEAQFVKNTAVNVQTLAGWNVWYAPYRADAPLTRLDMLAVNTGYLIHALDAVTLTFSGEVVAERIRWTPNSYNLVGFPVAARGGPTFSEFFQGPAAHNHNKIYRLVNGGWRQVLNPANETLRSGEAFWVYCDGASDFQGPLSVKASSTLGLVLGDATKGSIEFRNASAHPLAFSLEQVPEAGKAALPLASVIMMPSSNTIAMVDMPIDFPDGTWVQDFPAFDAGKGMTLPVMLRVGDVKPGTYSGLLKITTDLGTETWLPVRANREI